MENEIIDYVSDDNVPAIADDNLLRVAEMAERRIEAVIKIKQMALKVTNAGDWNDQGGRPYLQVSGSEKVANLFNISWRLDEPTIDTEADGHFTYTMRGIFSIPGRSISAEGSRSSKDPFFKKYEYVNNQRIEKPISAIDRRDVRMAALTNLLGNGITRLLGIRNLSYGDLEAFAGISKEMVSKVEYKSKGKEPIKTPTEKKDAQESPTEKGKEVAPVSISDAQRKRFYAIYKGAGKTDEQVKEYLKTKYGIEHSKDIPKAVYEIICAWAEEQEEAVQIDCPKLKIKIGKLACEKCSTSDDCENYQMFLDSQR